MELCIDKEETVAAATGGQGAPIYSPISPSVWTYEPGLRAPVRDPDAARQLIEESGWTAGDDGIYRRGDERLATAVPVRDNPQWIRFVELLAVQVRDCGIELTLQPMDFPDLVATVEWPLIAPGADEQWDALFSAWITTPDPDATDLFHSRAVVTASNPFGFNFMGYSSAESDALLDRARSTYDPRERARLYREHQRVLANDRPMLFAWSALIREPRSSRFESTVGPLRTDTATWWWELETLFVRSPTP
jgi:peptide/nickel transport system substrate-binding protein